jgi:hypothetical protein
MFGESGASAKNCIWSATLTQRAQAKVIVAKLERWCQDKMWERLLHVARHSKDFHQSRSGGTPAFVERFASTPANLGRTCDNAPHTAEG